MVGGHRVALPPRHVLVLVATALVLAVALAVVAARPGDVDELTGAWLVTVARTVTVALFVTAGALRLTRWRITAEAYAAYLGAALVLLGGVTLPLWHLTRTLQAGDPTSLLAVLTRSVGTGAVAVLLLRAFARGDDDSLRISPREVVLHSGTATAAAAALLLTSWTLSPAWLDARGTGQVAVGVCLALLWWVVAATAVLRGTGQRWMGELAPLLAALGVVEILRLLDGADAGAWTLAAALSAAVVAAVAACTAVLDLLDAARTEQQRVRALSDALSAANETTTQADAWREELTHDLRNAIAGLRAALHTLGTYGEELDPAVARQLRSAAVDEVEHLEHLVCAGAEHEVVVDFEAAEVVRTVAAARRATGQDVRLHGRAGLVRGRPGDLATVLQNLLVNAAVHAPRSVVTVSLTGHDGCVEIAVSDRGPGLSAEDAQRAFVRGARGVGSSGSGLGLYVVRSLMQRAGGDVELRNRVGGATFVLTLPTVERRSAGATPVGTP